MRCVFRAASALWHLWLSQFPACASLPLESQRECAQCRVWCAIPTVTVRWLTRVSRGRFQQRYGASGERCDTNTSTEFKHVLQDSMVSSMGASIKERRCRVSQHSMSPIAPFRLHHFECSRNLISSRNPAIRVVCATVRRTTSPAAMRGSVRPRRSSETWTERRM